VTDCGLQQLLEAPLHLLSTEAPDLPGVYIIYDADGSCDHVGQSITLLKRLKRHAPGGSDFAVHLYEAPSARARREAQIPGHHVRWLVVENRRQRFLLEHLATGTLCPRYQPE
jgi:excinuclease UvrABC nuclease subunit